MRGNRRISGTARRQQIVAVATDLFSARGFRGTTTRQIAQQARVSEALLFRHFPDKESLYWAVIGEKLRARGGRRYLETMLSQNGNDREVFASLAESFIEQASKDTALSRLLLFSALENHRLSARFFRTHIASYYETLSSYVRARVKSGEFREVDPLLAARSFLGMVIYHNWIQELFGGKRYKAFGARSAAETFAEIWLQGMRRPAASSKKKE